jgi:hypothetical protein
LKHSFFYSHILKNMRIKISFTFSGGRGTVTTETFQAQVKPRRKK